MKVRDTDVVFFFNCFPFPWKNKKKILLMMKISNIFVLLWVDINPRIIRLISCFGINVYCTHYNKIPNEKNFVFCRNIKLFFLKGHKGHKTIQWKVHHFFSVNSSVLILFVFESKAFWIFKMTQISRLLDCLVKNWDNKYKV